MTKRIATIVSLLFVLGIGQVVFAFNATGAMTTSRAVANEATIGQVIQIRRGGRRNRGRAWGRRGFRGNRGWHEGWRHRRHDERRGERRGDRNR